MQITYYGHSCFGVEIQGKHLVFDPFITPNPLAQAISLDNIPADFILVSHGHGDHVADVLALAEKTGAKLISNFEIVSWFENQGLEGGFPMNHGGTWNLGFANVKYVSAIHSSTLPDGSSGGNAGGFIVESVEGAFYYSGDTALTYDMKLIGEYHKLDFAFLCIGDIFTMGIKDAAIASDFIACDQIIGMHYATFPYIEIDPVLAVEYFQEKGKVLTLMEIGASKQVS